MSNLENSGKSFRITFAIFITISFIICSFYYYRLNFDAGFMARMLTRTLTLDGVFFCIESGLLLAYLYFLALFWKKFIFTKKEVKNGG